MPIMPEGLKYLGMPVFWGRNKSNWLSPLISRIEKRLSNSSLSSLPFAGRSCLVQSVSNTMSNYLMSCFTLSQKIIRSINKSQSKFWWGKRVDKFLQVDQMGFIMSARVSRWRWNKQSFKYEHCFSNKVGMENHFSAFLYFQGYQR